MLPNKDFVVCLLFLWIFVNDVKCQSIEEMSETLDKMLVRNKLSRRPRDHEDISLFWQNYEFGTGAGNREEIVVTDIFLGKYTDIPDNINWQFLQTENFYLIRAENSTLLFYKFNLDNLLIEHITSVTTEGRILLFKVLNLNTEETKLQPDDLMAILFVESQHGNFLYWYRILGNTYTYTLYLKWSVQQQLQDITFVREKSQYELLLLDNNTYLGEQLVDVYSFNIDIINHRINIWFCQRLYVEKIFDVQICPIYENTVLVFRGVDSVVLYKPKNEDTLCQFEKSEVIKSSELKNFVCFESGYIEYFAIAGKEARLFHFFEDEFQEDETDLNFNETTEIVWVTPISLNTYREESLLLVQFKNATIVALAWQGLRFKRVSLPNQIMNDIDLSRVVIIPKFGFVYGNVLVRIEMALKESTHPSHDETESMLKTRALLEEVFRKQEAILDNTETLLNQSYFINSVMKGSWNFSKVSASNVTIGRDVNFGTVRVGSLDLKVEDVSTNLMSILEKLEELDKKLDQILSNDGNSMKINLPSDVEINADFLVNGTLHAKNVTVDVMHIASISTVINNIEKRAADKLEVDGKKYLPFIDIYNLTIFSLNGVPVEEIVFDTVRRNYSDIDFSKIKRLEIDGHLNFSKINGIVWENIVWKNTTKFIPGETIMEAQLVADEANITYLNQLQYPQDYVLINNKSFTKVTGEKYFSNLSVEHLVNISKINRIDIDDFIILNRHEVIDHEITFENLTIEVLFQVDGNITGLNISNIEGLLNETDKLSTNVVFENLTVLGNIVVEDSINTKTWSDFGDLLLKTEENAVITGYKKFLSDVTFKSVKITSAQINDRPITDFVTLNTDQHFPYLKKISANVTFGNVTLGAMKKLEDYITRKQNKTTGCFDEIVFFDKPPIIDELSFDTLKQTISRTAFIDKLNQLFQKGFENLTLSTLMADEIVPCTINGIWNYTDLANNKLTVSTQQKLTGSLIVNNLETVILDAETINGISVDEVNQLLVDEKLFHEVLLSNTSIESLLVTGYIKASSINDRNIVDIYKGDNMRSITFDQGISIENLTVLGYVNGLNISEFVADTVRKTDKNVTFTGHKIFDNVTCKFLEVRFLNGHSVDDILDPEKENQVLKGPVIVNGSVTVLNHFNATGKVGGIFLRDFTERLKPLGNNTYVLRGNFRFTENTSIAKLDVNGSIQGLMFDNFLQTTISKNEAHVTISGMKIFSGPIAFYGIFVIDGSLDDIDLQIFHEKAVYIDKPFSIDSKVVFKDDVYIRKNLVVRKKLRTKSIMGVDIEDLQENAAFLNRHTYFSARMTLDNVTFYADINVAQVNDLQMDQLISLHDTQLIGNLKCNNVTYKNIELFGRVNYRLLDDIYKNTFMKYGNQNVMGNIRILKNVYAYHNFNAYLINNINPKQIISLTSNNTLTGNFIFKDPVILNGSLRILGSLNGIRLIGWQGAAVKTIGETKQIITGKWRVHGNVHFEKNVDGSEFLNGVNITKVSAALTKYHGKIDDVIEKTNETLNYLCEDLNILKCNAVNQIYKFNMFDYFKMLIFNDDIHDIRIIEQDNQGYLLVNYGICHVKVFLYTLADIQEIDEVSDFGLIDRWIFFKSNHTIYMFTIAKRTCNGSLNNIWKLENNRLIHVLEIGNATTIIDLYQDTFVAVTRENFATASADLQAAITKAVASYKSEKRRDLSLNSDPIVLAIQSLIYEQGKSTDDTALKNCIDCDILLNFRVGIFEREEYVYYNENISQNYIYLCKNDTSQTKILQIIKAHRPRSFLILNFDGLVETLLIFVENNEIIQIYEYRGIEGFMYKNAIKMKTDKLYHLKMRKYTNVEKKHYLAAIHGNRLTILEAKMHGERLDLGTLITDGCYMNMCLIH